ncbi:trans-1,2-dihydrobenzene-1,2-diol dehydrogenase [Halyomorpha halys]|uniref:trans-1,2-dihydrobenzene-1,2-diol dehydrogenase n=1 Tax=Halyomorpha halys TaxID=286706 RepID=UPI0006D4FF66|nr:trans-1,2-dihydrobenzene-1,2-diol dehydrogenase-like [Halyomorpha halys]
MALRWGIMSTGKISNDFANALNYLPKDEHIIIGVAASQKETAEEFARKHEIPQAYNNYEELAKDTAIDVVYIGSNNDRHYELCKLVLLNQKHLLCEKPLGLNYKESQELVLLAKQKKLFLMEALWSRFFPVYNELVELLASKTIGDLVYLSADFGVPVSVDRMKNKQLGEGTIYELGGYVLQLAILVFGRNPKSISAFANFNENGVDESINYIIKYPDGKTACFCTHSKIRMINSAVIYGTKGSIKLKDPFWAPTDISINNERESRHPLPLIEKEKFYTNSEGLVYEAVEVRNCIKRGYLESAKMTHNDTLTIARWQEDISGIIKSQI